MHNFIRGQSPAPYKKSKMTKSMSRSIAGLGLLLASCCVFSLPTSNPVPGGIVNLKIAPASELRPNVFYQNQPVAMSRHEGFWYAIVGLSLNTKLGHHEVRVKGQGIPFNVNSKDYPEQHITLKSRKHIDLSPHNLNRHKGEKKLAGAVFDSFDLSQAPDLAFIKPVLGPYSSPFGLKRFFNKSPRKPHSGLDIAAPTGTPIKSPAAGKVVLTGNFFFNGNVVYMDHGQGLISMFCHLSDISVAKGDIMHKGQILGKVGATGRVTGPHLHWSVSLNNARIDPLLLLPSDP
jgi:hypothetical protein